MKKISKGVPGPFKKDKIIWTNHAVERLSDRRMTKDKVAETLEDPDYAQPGKQPGTYEYGKKHGKKYVTVIVKPSDSSKAVVVSCWIDPPEPGTEDWKDKNYYVQYKRARSIWGQLWVLFKQQLGV